MITRLWSTPPHTLGTLSPACSATSMNSTGEAAELDTAALTAERVPHFHSGVISVSSSVLPSTKKVDPMKRRRGIFIELHDHEMENYLPKPLRRNKRSSSC